MFVNRLLQLTAATYPSQQSDGRCQSTTGLLRATIFAQPQASLGRKPIPLNQCRRALVRAPTPEDEDRRRLCRERKTLTNERVQHVNRIKGLLVCQGISGYEPCGGIDANGSMS
jgi:hypothetical protein